MGDYNPRIISFYINARHPVMSRLLLGKIATAHGVRGLVKVLVLGDDPQRLESCGPAWTAETGGRALNLRMKNPMGKYYIAAIDGLSDRNEAELLRNTELWIDRDKLPDTEDGTYYYADLTGLAVVDGNGALYGHVIAVENFGASDLLEIKPENGPSFYVPFVDDYVLEVENDKIVAAIPRDLLDINLDNNPDIREE